MDGAKATLGMSRQYWPDLIGSGTNQASAMDSVATARRRVDHNWTEARIELTRGMIREAEAKYLELANYLNATGLGSDPRLIHKLAARQPNSFSYYRARSTRAAAA